MFNTFLVILTGAVSETASWVILGVVAGLTILYSVLVKFVKPVGIIRMVQAKASSFGWEQINVVQIKKVEFDNQTPWVDTAADNPKRDWFYFVITYQDKNGGGRAYCRCPFFGSPIFSDSDGNTLAG